MESAELWEHGLLVEHEINESDLDDSVMFSHMTTLIHESPRGIGITLWFRT